MNQRGDHRNCFWGAGRFGFQKEMNALQSLSTGNEEEAYNTTALLKSTHEVEERIQEVYRYHPLPRQEQGVALTFAAQRYGSQDLGSCMGCLELMTPT